MFVDGRWIDVPSERIQYRGLLGDTGESAGGHWCGSLYQPDVSSRSILHITKCAFAQVEWLFQGGNSDKPQYGTALAYLTKWAA
jgi:hypothetical protein